MHCFSLSLRSATALIIGLSAATASAQWYTIDPLPPFDTHAQPRAISRDNNVVTGFSSYSYTINPFKWTPAGGTFALPVPDGFIGGSGLCLSADGSVIGGDLQYSPAPNTIGSRPVKWTSSGYELLDVTDPLHPGGTPFFCSPDGSAMYGTAWDNTNGFQAVRWDSSGITHDLLVPSGAQYGGVSDDGQYRTGSYLAAFNDFRGYLISPSGVTTLQPLSAIHMFSAPGGISGDGQVVVGYALDDAGIYTAVKWTSAGVEEIPALSGPKVYGGNAFMVNTDGSVIMLNSEGVTCIWSQSTGTVEFRNYLAIHGVQGFDDVHSIFPMIMSPDGTTFAGQLLTDEGYQFFYVRIGDVGTAPHANAGPDQTPAGGQAVTLDGTGSYDDEGGVLKYKWMEGGNVLGTTETLEWYFGPGHHDITLIVTDKQHLKGIDTMTVDINDTPPTISLNDVSPMVVDFGTTFSDPGATAYDDQDGALGVNVDGSVNTLAVGSYTLTYYATDSANNYVSVTRCVTVIYPWSGFLQPINMDGTSIFKLGSTVPVKFMLNGAAANLSISAHLYAAKLSGSVIGSEIEAVSTVAADSGNTFRVSGGGNYTFNLNTKGMSAGTWQLRADLGDGVLHTVLISLKP
jgi:uncharacterized membrane protein